MSGRTYRDGELVDFAIVGSGVAGGTIARELSQAGLSVVLLEQGPRLTPAQFEHDELKYWFLSGITNDVVKNPQTFRDEPSKKAEPGLLRPYLWYARTVGGTSVHYTANYWRFHPIDFNERSALGPISGTGFADWPLDYPELEPYYTKVDWDIGVSGLAGASPFDPPRTKPYPMPPLPVKSSGVLFERGARKLGLHPFPAPMAINSVQYNGRPACVHCGFCHGFGCEVTAKSSTLTTMIPQAEATGRCEVRPRATSCVSRPTRAVAPRASRTSTRRAASTSSMHAQLSCAQTAPRRRGFSSCRRTRVSPRALPTPADSWAST
jgi:choline dehydrogenase-like flavoprotein